MTLFHLAHGSTLLADGLAGFCDAEAGCQFVSDATGCFRHSSGDTDCRVWRLQTRVATRARRRDAFQATFLVLARNANK